MILSFFKFVDNGCVSIENNESEDSILAFRFNAEGEAVFLQQFKSERDRLALISFARIVVDQLSVDFTKSLSQRQLHLN